MRRGPAPRPTALEMEGPHCLSLTGDGRRFLSQAMTQAVSYTPGPFPEAGLGLLSWGFSGILPGWQDMRTGLGVGSGEPSSHRPTGTPSTRFQLLLVGAGRLVPDLLVFYD